MLNRVLKTELQSFKNKTKDIFYLKEIAYD